MLIGFQKTGPRDPDSENDWAPASMAINSRLWDSKDPPFGTLLTRNCPKVLNVRLRDDKFFIRLCLRNIFFFDLLEKKVLSFTVILRTANPMWKKTDFFFYLILFCYFFILL